MLQRVFLLFTMLFFCFRVCLSQKKVFQKPIVSAALAQRIYYGTANDSTDIILALKKEAIFSAEVASTYRLLYRYRNFIAVRIPLKHIHNLAANSNTVFADIIKKPTEELTTGYLDLSVNKLNYAQFRFPAIRGNNVIASVKEQQFDTTDIDYAGRYINSGAGAPAVTTHAAAMATALAGAGNTSPAARGAAPAALVTSTSFASLLPEADAYYGLFKISIQNHSYGTAPENYYGAEAAAYDQSVATNPELVHVFSAGNAGNAAGTGTYTQLQGWSNLTGNFKTAKNVLVVGAIDSFYKVAAASSKGPAFDGRVKPELVAFGEDGSSGAAAIVSGTAALVQQAYRDKNNQLPPAALVKAVLLNSADAVAQKNLSHASGYGSLNGFHAVQTVLKNNLFEASVQHGVLKKFDLIVPVNTARLKITLCWTDVQAPVNAPNALVNDLDAILKNEATGESWLPWVLNSTAHADSLTKDAARKKDTVNNTEQITLDNPAPGSYSLEITGHNVVGAAQRFAIAYQLDTMNHFEWTFPAAPDAIVAGQTNIVRWQTTITGTAAIEYTTDYQTWKTLADTVDLSAGYFKWPAPDILHTARLRMRFLNGKAMLSDTFVISKPIAVQTGFGCADSLLIYWNHLPALQYRIYNLGNRYLEPVGATGDTMAVFKTGFHASPFYSVAPIINGREGMRSPTINYRAQGADCYFRSFYTLSQTSAAAAFAVRTGTYYNVAAIALQKWNAGNYNSVRTINEPQTTGFTFSDSTLQQGVNSYRIQVILKSGAVLYSEVVSIYHFTDASVIIYPNPALQHTPVNLITNKAGRVRIAVFSAGGQLMQQQILTGLSNKMMLTPLPKGMYFIRVLEDDGKRYTQKLIVY